MAVFRGPPTPACLSLPAVGLYDGMAVTATTQPPGRPGLEGANLSPEPSGLLARAGEHPASTCHWAAGSWWSATSSSHRRPRRRAPASRPSWPGPSTPGTDRGSSSSPAISSICPAVPSPLEEARRSLEAHPALEQALSRFLTVDGRRVIRQTGTHEPGYGTDPASASILAARGAELLRAGGPPPPDGHRCPRGAGRARRARLRHGVQRARDRVRPGRRRQARSRRPLPGRPRAGGRWPPSPPTTRPGCSASIDSAIPPPCRDSWSRARSTVGWGGTPGGSWSPSPWPACCGWPSRPGCRATWARDSRPGPSATPTRPTWVTRSSSPRWCPWSCWPCWHWSSAS